MSRKKIKTNAIADHTETRERGRPARGFDVHAFQLRIPVTLHRAILAALAKTRRTKSAEIVLAIEKHLTEMGLWPPKDNE